MFFNRNMLSNGTFDVWSLLRSLFAFYPVINFWQQVDINQTPTQGFKLCDEYVLKRKPLSELIIFLLVRTNVLAVTITLNHHNKSV